MDFADGSQRMMEERSWFAEDKKAGSISRLGTNFMLPRRFRLNDPIAFRACRRIGRKQETPIMVVFFRVNNLHAFRLGIVVSKKFSLKATDRNRARRLCHAASASLKDRALDVIIIPKKELLASSPQKIQEELRAVLPQ